MKNPTWKTQLLIALLRRNGPMAARYVFRMLRRHGPRVLKYLLNLTLPPAVATITSRLV